MQISISDQTHKLLQSKMARHGYATPDDALKVALERLDEPEARYIEDLDPQTQAAIEEALAESDRGEGRPWEEVREEIRTRFIKP